LVEQVVAAVAGVAEHEIRLAGAVVDPADLHRTADGHAEVLTVVGGAAGLRIGSQLIRRGVEHGPAERVVRRRGVRVLTSTAPADREIAAAAWSTRPARSAATGKAARSATAFGAAPSIPWSTKPAEAARCSLRTREAEPWRQLSADRIELAAAERREPLAHHAAIDVGHVAGERDQLCGAVGRESRRQQLTCRRLLGFTVESRLGDERACRLLLHGQRLERLRGLSAASLHRRRLVATS
jgi:hypothetical protein